MTTLTNTETLEAIAERVVDANLDIHQYSASRRDLIAATLSALRNERQRAVDIARGEDCGLNDCLCATRIAAMIREGR